MLFGVPRRVKAFFGKVRGLSKPIRQSLPVMVMALLLAPHRRCLRTLGGMVLGGRSHAGTISRRLRSRRWATRDWYQTLYAGLLEETDRWERDQAPAKRRHWVVVIDPTFHSTHAECMENLVLRHRPRRDRRRRQMRQHIFVMGTVLTDKGGRLPLPRKSYYTREYCRTYGKRYRTQVELVVQMLHDMHVPDDVEVTVVYDSALDANKIHRECRRRGFREVFPLDSNRNLAVSASPEAAASVGQTVVAWTRSWRRQEFTILELQVENEDHVFKRRRHVDNLTARKTQRRYAVAARRAAVSKLGTCQIVTSYKENPKIELLPGESADWWTYQEAPVRGRGHGRPQPARWHRKVLACTDVLATAQQVVQWYEVRWQIELFFRELKSRRQLGGYVLHKFAAVERYLDLLMMGMLLLEKERLRRLQQEPPGPRGGEARTQARTTDQLRGLEKLCGEWNAEVLQEKLASARGRKKLRQQLRQECGRVA